jgi:IS30 family transposase
MQIVKQRALNDFIDAALLKQQSPDAIAGRLATGLDGLPSVSADSIYRYIASVHGRQIEYARALVRKQTKARKHRPIAERLQDRTFIDKRPAVITNRERVGDLEADFIVSGKAGTGYLLTAVDRKIRYGFIRLILPVTIANVEAAFQDIQILFPELSSLTLDNDILFRFHERLSELLSVPIYFTEPYASWQKGSVENYNKQVRKYVKKGADISQHPKEYLGMAESRLNDRYMSVLHYRTPAECLTAHRMGPTRQKTR